MYTYLSLSAWHTIFLPNSLYLYVHVCLCVYMYESVCVVFVVHISIPPALYISTSCMHTQKSIVYVEHM